MTTLSASQTTSLFIVGSDTDVGKTYVAATIVRRLLHAGLRVGVYKPVASGCTMHAGTLLSADAQALWDAAGRPGTLDEVCPQRYVAPLAPNIAARKVGATVDDGLLRQGIEPWLRRSDVVVAEGAGGWFSPLSDATTVADLAVEWGWPVVIVVADRLGAINQARLVMHAVRTYRGGTPIAGVVLNQVDVTPDDASTSNADELRRLEPTTPILTLAHRGSSFTPEVDFAAWASLGR